MCDIRTLSVLSFIMCIFSLFAYCCVMHVRLEVKFRLINTAGELEADDLMIGFGLIILCFRLGLLR